MALENLSSKSEIGADPLGQSYWISMLLATCFVILAGYCLEDDDRDQKYQHLCAVEYRGTIVSGGFLVRLNVMISSAVHLGGNVQDYMVYTNRYNLSRPLDKEERQLQIVEVRNHPKYTRRDPNFFNVAAVLLQRSVNANLAITLEPDSYQLYNYTHLEISGWGTTSKSRLSTPATVEVSTFIPCSKLSPRNSFCVKRDSREIGFDTGTPLVTFTPRGRPIILGIGAWNYPFEASKMGLAFTRVYPISDWIQETAVDLNKKYFPSLRLY